MIYGMSSSHRVPWSILKPAAIFFICTITLSVCPGLCRGAGAIGGPPGPDAPTWTEPITGMEFIRIPGGCYEMGRSPGVEEKLRGEVGQRYMDKHYADETPRQEVCVEPFWMSRYEITQSQWEKITGEKDQGCVWTGRGPDYPINYIKYAEAQDFAYMLTDSSNDGNSFRLPTEAEWEFACRAGSDTPFYTGWSITAEDAHFDYEHGFGTREHVDNPVRPQTLAPVGSYPPNKYGLYDMHGNVAEWTSTLYGDSPGDHPAFENSESLRVVKGGGFKNRARDLRCGARDGAGSLHVNCHLGMRLVRVPPETTTEAGQANATE